MHAQGRYWLGYDTVVGCKAGRWDHHRYAVGAEYLTSAPSTKPKGHTGHRAMIGQDYRACSEDGGGAGAATGVGSTRRTAVSNGDTV
jgi:hypothetical protein